MTKKSIYKSLSSILYTLIIVLPVALLVHLDRYCIQIGMIAVALCAAFILTICKDTPILKKLQHTLVAASIILIAIIATAKCLWPKFARYDVPAAYQFSGNTAKCKLRSEYGDMTAKRQHFHGIRTGVDFRF